MHFLNGQKMDKNGQKMHQRRDTGGNLTGHVDHAAGLTPEGQEAEVVEHCPFPSLPFQAAPRRG